MSRGRPLQGQVKGDSNVSICSICSLVTEATSHESKISSVYYYICIEFIIKEILMVLICLISILITKATSQELKISNMCVIYVLNL